MKIAAAYIRVSTEEQVEYSPDSQIKMVRDYAKHNNMIIPDEFIFIDDGISGKNTIKRPAFNRMIGTAKIKPKPFEAILLWKFSRFARNREDSIVYKSMLRKQLGIEVISVSENLGDDKMSILIEALIEAMDEYYSINLAEEVKRGMSEKVSRGEPVAIPSFGYDIKDKQYIPNKATAPIVQKIFNDFIAGTSYKELAIKLNATGTRTSRGGLWENRTISYILNNPVYIGKIRWSANGTNNRNFANPNLMIVNGNHQPIIDIDIWEQAQARIKSIKAMYPKYSRNTVEVPYMLQGLLKCSACGRTLVRVSGKADTKSLQCHGYAHGQCTVSHSIVMHRIESLVISQIETDLASGQYNLFVKPPHDNEYVTPLIDAQIQREYSKLERVKQAYESGIDTLEEYKVNKEKLTNHIAELELQRPVKSDNGEDIATINFLIRCKDALTKLKSSNLQDKDKNALLRAFIHKIVFNRPQCSLQIFYYA
ncbi:MAG: recombinase family protein [Oscillospiraceae bacterium]